MIWVDIQAEVIQETDKAVELGFIQGQAGLTTKYVWVPKLCYREIEDDVFNRQQVKAWFYYKEKMYRL